MCIRDSHEDHKDLVGRSLRFEDLAELIQRATAVAGLGDGLEIAEEVHCRSDDWSIGRSDDQRSWIFEGTKERTKGLGKAWPRSTA